jgi:ABC-type glycerol-3-phosphate transport system permease component
MVPLFIAWRQLGLIDAHLGMIIIYTGLYSPFALLLLVALIHDRATGRVYGGRPY